ncbi:hypothetical protein E2P81_ATG01379 [Venturia nashicola]|uniref:Uncharacterized protein n=1 Tax=Venturia nashicola TaxID=86259 RepID=A0A4Z1PC17_9PEZI|nr:hypothetical protein E6O75_ATG01411 [Venturia nashicola]TLD38836.1 hypothetical protein E2P81_ATG01379 [Venturia nashicola]
MRHLLAWHEGIRYRIRYRKNPPQSRVILDENSYGAEFTGIFQYWAQFVERAHTLNLHSPAQGLFTNVDPYPARYPPVDEYTTCIKYWEQLKSQQPAPDHE